METSEVYSRLRYQRRPCSISAYTCSVASTPALGMPLKAVLVVGPRSSSSSLGSPATWLGLGLGIGTGLRLGLGLGVGLGLPQQRGAVQQVLGLGVLLRPFSDSVL